MHYYTENLTVWFSLIIDLVLISYIMQTLQ